MCCLEHDSSKDGVWLWTWNDCLLEKMCCLDERDKVQKKTFTKWVNKHLIRARKHVTDLYEDLRDGHNLSTLLEVLSKDTLPRERGKMRFHRLQNIQIALDYLRQRQIKLVNIRSDDIADGNPKLTLGLIWTIILHFQISEVQVLGQSEDMTAKEKLLLWSQKMVNTYPGLQCGNFSTSWRDGRLFNAIIHRHRPDLVDMHMVEQQDNRQNLEQAFLIAEQELGVTRLLDPEDIDVSSPDEKSIITYVSSLYDVMPKIPDVVGGLTAEEANVKYKEYRELVSSLLMWILRQISIMEDRTFPDDLSTLKALYSTFVQFKSTEFEMKLTEKNKVEDIFRLLKAWFQSGRIHLDTGFHPDDVDLEWDKLVKAMEDRDTVLHFEIERLEMLHRIASLVGNDLTCSAQLLSKASAALQADIDLTTAGQQPKETAVISHYLSEIEVKIKKVFIDIQTLREGKHVLAEEFYSRALTLHEQLTALRAEHGVLLDKAGRLQERATRETREAVARAVAEDESCLKFVHDLLKWLEDMQTRVGELDWGSDLPAVEKNMSDHKDLHRSIEEFRSSIEEAKASETKVSSSLQSEYMSILNKLELHHTKLLDSSRSRQRHLDSLYNFMLRATKELVWLNQKEEDEIGYDWSEHNTDMATKKNAYSELMQVLELKEPVLKGIQAMGEDLISDGHPAKGPIQAYSAVMNTQWNWLLQLCTSVETHLAGNSAFFKFFEDVKQNEEHLKHLQDSMWRRFGCNKSTSLIAVDNVLQACVDEKEKLMDYKSHVSELVSRSKKIVQLKQRSPDCGVRNPLPVKALCDYKQLEITLHKGEECALIDNSDPIKWTVLSSFGRKARIPSACFVIPPPNSDALDAAESMDKLYHDVIGFWHQLYGNLRCMLSWHHLQNTVASVRSWTFQEFRTLRPEEHSEVMHSLGTHYEEFVQISRDANLFGPADLGQAERDYNLCKQHYEQLLHKLKKEDADEAACQHLLAELRVISQRLESYEERMIRLIRTPLGPDAAPGVSSRIAEQQRLYSEVEGIRAGLDRTRESCTEVLARSPTVPSQPNLRSELSVVLQKAEDIYSLSSVYLEKLKTVDLVVKYLHDAESLVKSYETRLCAEEGVPAEPERVRQYIAQIKAWHAEANEELPLFHGLQEEVHRAQALNERMLVAHGERSVDLERFQERTEQLLQRWQGMHAQVDNRVRELEALSKVMSNYRTLRTELNVWLGAAVKQQDELQTSHTHDSHMLSQQLTRQKDLILDLDKHRAKLDECQRYSTEYYTRVKDYELQLMAYWTMVEKTPPKKKLLTSSADATNEEIMELRNRHSSQLSQAQEHEKFIEETLQRVQEEEMSLEKSRETHLDKVNGLLEWVGSMVPSSVKERANFMDLDNNTLKVTCSQQEEMLNELASQKANIAEAIRQTESFLVQNEGRLTDEQKQELEKKLSSLQTAYGEICAQASKHLEDLQKESKRKDVEVRQQECSQKMSRLDEWFMEASTLLSKDSPSSEDLQDLQQRQIDHQNLHSNVVARALETEQMLKNIQEFLDENRDALDPDFVAEMEQKLAETRARHQDLQKQAQHKQKELEVAVASAIKQNTEKLAVEEQQEENKTRIEELLGWLATLGNSMQETSSLNNLDGSNKVDEIKAHHQTLLSKQHAVIMATQQCEAFLERHGDTLSQSEREASKQRLHELLVGYEAALKMADGKVRLGQALHEEVAKFDGDCNEFSGWLSQAEAQVSELRNGAESLPVVDKSLQRQESLMDEVLSRKGDQRFLSRSAKKVAEAEHNYRELCAHHIDQPSGPDFDSVAVNSRVQDRLQEVNKRFGNVQSECNSAKTWLEDLQKKMSDYEDAGKSVLPWLNEAEKVVNTLMSTPLAATVVDLQKQLDETKNLQEDIITHKQSVDRLCSTGNDLLAVEREASPNHEDIRSSLDGISQRYNALNSNVAQHEDKLQMMLERSASIEEGLEEVLRWLENMEMEDSDFPLMSENVEQMMSKNAALGKDLERRRSQLVSMRKNIENFATTADPKTVETLRKKLHQAEEKLNLMDSNFDARNETLSLVVKKLAIVENSIRKLESVLGPDGELILPLDGSAVIDYNSHDKVLEELKRLAEELSALEPSPARDQMLAKVNSKAQDIEKLQRRLKEREAQVASCQKRVDEFRTMVESLKQWLSVTENRVPVTSRAGSEALQEHRQLVASLLTEWESKGALVNDMKEHTKEMEELLISVLFAGTMADSPLDSDAAVNVNGHSVNKELASIQGDVEGVCTRYDAIGKTLNTRWGEMDMALQQTQAVVEKSDSLIKWLAGKQAEVATWNGVLWEIGAMKAEADRHKIVLMDIEDNAGRVHDLQTQLLDLLQQNRNSAEAAKWKQMLNDIEEKWSFVTQSARERQNDLEESCALLEKFQTAEGQLSQWLMEKQLLMSVLGPLSIDPNMLDNQKQQVQFMLKEFETRHSQYEALNQAADALAVKTTNATGSGAQVEAQKAAVNTKWAEVKKRLTGRATSVEQTREASIKYGKALQALSGAIDFLSARLSSIGAVSSQPEAVKQQLETASEVAAELGEWKVDAVAAERLCQDIGDLVGEAYLRAELQRRLNYVLVPMEELEQRIGHQMNQLQEALASSQQFQQMFDELRIWLDKKQAEMPTSLVLSADLEELQTQLGARIEFQKSLNQHAGTYSVVQTQGETLLQSLPEGTDRETLQVQLKSLCEHWEDVLKHTSESVQQLQDALRRGKHFEEISTALHPWLEECENKSKSIGPAVLVRSEVDLKFEAAKALQLEMERCPTKLEELNNAADAFLECCLAGDDAIRDEKAQLNQRADNLSEDIIECISSLDEMALRLAEFNDVHSSLEARICEAQRHTDAHDALSSQNMSNKQLEKLRAQLESLQSQAPRVKYLQNLAQGLVADVAPEIDKSPITSPANTIRDMFQSIVSATAERCATLETRLQGVNRVQEQVRELFSGIADLDDELDAIGPTARVSDAVQSQLENVQEMQVKLHELCTAIQQASHDCVAMQENEGGLDVQSLKREVEALRKQSQRLADRMHGCCNDLKATLSQLIKFCQDKDQLCQSLQEAAIKEQAQEPVARELETINQQMEDFQAFQKDQIEPLQSEVQKVNGLGQGLIQSAAKGVSTQVLEQDLEQIGNKWDVLSKKVTDRSALLQQALLHCGKFQDAFESLLSWLTDMEELTANQKPLSAEFKVVKAQIQEQKLLQKLLDDRKPSVEMIRSEGAQLAAAAEPPEHDRFLQQLDGLAQRWGGLLSKAETRQKQLESIQVVAEKFHKILEPLLEWLSSTERKLSSLEPVGTQATKIQQQILQHKSLEEVLSDKSQTLHKLLEVGQSLKAACAAEEREQVQRRMDQAQSSYHEVQDVCRRRTALLACALADARLFGEDEVELLNWLADVGDRLATVSIKDYQASVLKAQHDEQLSLHEEILSRKQSVDQAVKNGQTLIKQTTGDEILTIQQKLDDIKTRYTEIGTSSSKVLKMLEKALQLATRFEAGHEQLNNWMGRAEAELVELGALQGEKEECSSLQDRQNMLRKELAEWHVSLDTLNEVGNALLEVVPWRARDGLDLLIAATNERYRCLRNDVEQKVQELHAAVQRNQRFDQAADNELVWIAETHRKLQALDDISVEPDRTASQLQVQKAFSVDILRHKDSIDQLVKTSEELRPSCSEEQKAAAQDKLSVLHQRYAATSQLNAERQENLERAHMLATQFWETRDELEPWLRSAQNGLHALPPPSIEQDVLRKQQEDLRNLREAMAEHKPHVDKLNKLGPQLAALSDAEGPSVRHTYESVTSVYGEIRHEVQQRAVGLDKALSQSSQIKEFHDKMDTMLENLERVAQRLRVPPPIPADSDKIREQIGETKSAMLEFQKLQPTFTSLNSSGQELIMLSRKEQKEEMAKDIQGRLSSMQDLWGEIEQQTENHETRLVEVLDLADRFWANLAAALSSLQEQEGDLYLVETLGVDPSLIKQQEEILLAKREDLDCFQEDLEMLRYLGSKLISACGEPDKPEVKKSIDEVNVAWERLNKLVQGRMDKLDEAMRITLQYQDSLQNTFDWLENKLTYFDNLAPVGTELEIVKQQMDDLNKVKVESYQQQIEMERLSHQGEIMLRKVKEEQQRAVITGPLKDLKEQWESLDSKILNRQHKLETSLLALGQFQHTLEELFTWLGHTEGLLSEQNPVVNDPKAIEIELAKHLVLRNDVFAHKATVATVKQAGAEIVRSSDGGEVATLQNRLQSLQQRWDSVMLCTEQRRAELDKALQQARGFQGEVEALMQWLADLEGLLSDSQPVGGLPETAKEQLNAHLELCQEYEGQQVVYRRALEHCQLVEREGEGELGKRASIQDLEQKWRVVGNKLEERKTKLEAALKTAIDFHNSLQDLISWLTQTENALNLMSTPSLILDSVLFQIDGHKMLANEVNSRREQVVDLDKTGTHLKYFSRKQDVALIKNLMQSVQTRWECVLHGTLNRGRALDDARKRAKQFHEVWTKLMDWLEEAEKGLDLEPDCSNDPEKIKVQLSKHKEFQKTMGGKQPAYDTATRMGRVLNEKATLLDDEQGLEMMLSELRDKWDTVCGKSVERQHKLEEALLFSGQFAEALQVLIDWLYKVEPLLAEEQPVHGDVALVITLIEGHKAFQKELGKRASSVQALKRSTRDLEDGSNAGDQSWVHAQMAELSSQWESVCKLSLQKQGRLDAALKQAEEFRMLGQGIMDWLAEAEKTLRFHGILPEEVEAVQLLIEQHKEFLERLEEQQTEVNRAVTMGETILAVCHPDSSTTIKQWINIIRSRFEEVIMWARQHQVRLETSLNELLSNSRLLEDMLSWLQQAQEMIRQRDQESLPEQIDSLQYLISEHQTFMEEMMSKQPEMERMTKSYKRKPSVSDVQLFDRIRSRKRGAPPLGVVPTHAQPLETKNPRVTQLFNKWRQVWLMALERQRKLQDCLERLQELKDFESFDFDVWRRKYMQWMNHKKSRVMDFFRRIDKDQDGKITRQEFIDGILSSRFPTNRLEMVAVADIFDRDRDGYIDYYEFIAALHPNKDAYRPITDADKIEDEVTRQVAECKCTRRFQVEQIGENKYRFYLGNQFGDSQQLRLVRILRSTVMVRVGGGWMALDEFLVKNDPCRAKGRTNLELREKFIMPEGASQSMAPFRTRGRRSRPTSRTTSPVRGPHVHSSSCTTPSSTSSTTANTPRPSSATLSRNYDKPWLSNSRTSTPTKPLSQESDASPVEVTPIHGSRLRPPGYLSGKSLHVGEDSLTLDSTSDLHILQAFDMSRSPSRGGSRPGSRPGSRTSSRRGSESSDLDVPERANLATDGTEGLGGVDALGGSRPASRADKTTKIPKGAGSGTSNKLTRR